MEGEWQNNFRRAFSPPQLDKSLAWLDIKENKKGKNINHIYTNSPHLALIAKEKYPGLQNRVRFLVQYDIYLELYKLLNHKNHQYQNILASLKPILYGQALWICELEDKTDFSSDYFVLFEDFRFSHTYPTEFMAAVSSKVKDFGPMEIRRGKKIARGKTAAQAGLILKDEVLRAPCR